MTPADRYSLITLGRFTLLSPSGIEDESLAKRRLKLAVLTVLAMARRPIPRATLVEMFWGDQDEARARHSLSDALSHLRRVLGRSSITTNGADVALAPDAPLAVDALQLTEALEASDLDRAVTLYEGGFLDGVDIAASATFEHWITRERRRFEAAFLRACARLCEMHARARQWDRCAAIAERWLDIEPLSVDAALFRLNALKSPQTRDAAERALGEYAHLVARIAREHGLEPAPPVRQLAESIRDTLASLPATEIATTPALIERAPAAIEAVVGVASAPVMNESVPAAIGAVAEVAPDPMLAFSGPNVILTIARGPHPTARREWRVRTPRALQLIAGAAVIVIALGAFVTTRDRGASARAVPAAAARPRVAVVVEVPPGDSSISWLADGLPQMIADRLARNPDVDVVPVGQVRALRLRQGPPARDAATTPDLRDLARRVGASLVVNGRLGRDDDALVLDLTVQDGGAGRLVRSDALSRRDAVSLADEAAARILAAANAQRPGFGVAELETSSAEAYEQFVRATQSGQDGHYDDALHSLDRAIALDSGFVSAVHARLDHAVAHDEVDVVRRLKNVLERSGDRASEFDRMKSEANEALHNGEDQRAEAIGRQLVRRFPRDPRAYHMLAGVLGMHGRFDAAEALWERQLALDSLTMEAGSGPCAPCAGYGVLTRLRLAQGKWAGAEHAARRWIALQPDVPASWTVLAAVLAFTQRYDGALDAMRRAMALGAVDPSSNDLLGRLLLMARRYETVDSLSGAWMTSASPDLRVTGYDLRMMVERERGQFRAANATIDRMLAHEPGPNAGVLGVLMRGSNLGRLGDYGAAIAVYEWSVHSPDHGPPHFPPRPNEARGYCWHHALLADAIASSGDVARLRTIADTLALGCGRSYYGRDRLLVHHVRGLIAIQEQRWADAERELIMARWSRSESWTRTNSALAEVQMRLGRPADAIATLREAYASFPDGMSRYEPRSELDRLMAQAFRQAGRADSAAVYDAHATFAWRDADPEARAPLRRLASR